MAKDRIESKYVTVAPGVELHVLEISPEKVRPGMKTKGLPSPFFQDM